MDASATTLNINGPQTPEPQPDRLSHHRAPGLPPHSHKPNFGRYVAECAACVAKYPDGPPAKKKPAKKPAMSREDIIALLQEQAPQAVAGAPQGQLEQLVQLMLNKEAKTLRKEEDDAVRREASRQDMIRITKEHEQMIARNQAACGHVKENGRSAVNGQIHNDGLLHLFCLRCMKAFPPRRPRAEEISNGIEVS